MHLMLTNKGTTPLPIGTGQQGGYEALLPPGLEIPFAFDEITTLVFGEQPEAASRSKYKALKEVDPESPLALEYATDIDQWKGRSDEIAESAEMQVHLFIRNVGYNDVTVTTSDGPVTIGHGDGAVIWTIAGTITEGEEGAGTPPDTGGGPGPEPEVTVSGFTADQDPTATVAGGEITNGDTIALTATAGDPAAMAKIDGHSSPVYNASGGTVRISNLDLTGMDVTGLTASAVITPVADTSGTITAFTAANPTEATMDAEDQGLLAVGSLLYLEAKAGTPDAMALINGATVEVVTTSPVTLDFDLTGIDVTGLTADFTVG
jgi:hypothetical protein